MLLGDKVRKSIVDYSCFCWGRVHSVAADASIQFGGALGGSGGVVGSVRT